MQEQTVNGQETVVVKKVRKERSDKGVPRKPYNTKKKEQTNASEV